MHFPSFWAESPNFALGSPPFRPPLLVQEVLTAAVATGCEWLRLGQWNLVSLWPPILDSGEGACKPTGTTEERSRALGWADCREGGRLFRLALVGWGHSPGAAARQGACPRRTEETEPKNVGRKGRRGVPMLSRREITPHVRRHAPFCAWHAERRFLSPCDRRWAVS